MRAGATVTGPPNVNRHYDQSFGMEAVYNVTKNSFVQNDEKKRELKALFSVLFLPENRKPAEPAFDCPKAEGGVGALGTAIGMGLWDKPLRTLASPAASGKPWAAYL